MVKLREIIDAGQAIWYDYFRRSLITSGELQALIDQGLGGITSNPSIFEKAIAGSTDYDEDLRTLVAKGKPEREILEILMLDDIARAADLFRPMYDRLRGADGYVSIEVSPTLADDAEGMVAEARRFFYTLNRPNVMIKIPATPAGIPVIRRLIGEGINVNITLIFSLAQYDAVVEAYLSGLEKLAASGGDLRRVASVASFFVSRVDTAVDRALEKIGEKDLQGTIAIANAKVAYLHFKEAFRGSRWERLRALGARLQRPLWASTGTKNPSNPDTLYVDGLIGPDTINTVPPATLRAVLDHGRVANTLEADTGEARARLAHLSDLGVDLDAITRQLLDEGLAAFSKSMEAVLASIAEKRDHLLRPRRGESANLHSFRPKVEAVLAAMKKDRILHRIWNHDYTVWKPNPTEITNRLGWLHSAEVMMENVPRLKELLEAARSADYTHALLLGMGGSSLAPEIFMKTFGGAPGSLRLAVLDSTDPAAVLAKAEGLDPARTLFIVSTKSGGTVETLSFFRFFYNRVAAAVGPEEAGDHFIAITDPGSELDNLAHRYRFRATFLNDPTIGGRFSALSYFGLVPAALVGVDIPRLLDQALTVACGCESCVDPQDNPGAWLGAVLGVLARAGTDKVTFVTSPSIASFADWAEQLIAESTGKEGRGILPVAGEPLGPPEVYGDDRLFISLQLEGDESHDSALSRLESTGHPVVHLRLRDKYEIGKQFFLWEIAIAVAGHILGINPFDQPNVESAKALARRLVAEYRAQGRLPALKPALTDGDITVYSDISGKTAGEALTAFLWQAQPGSYVALQAYVQPIPEVDAALLEARMRIRARSKLTTTVGYGPRFLHSTGQLHKGDAGRGLFIQFTSDDPRDAPIPDEAGSPSSSTTFGVLKAAQALGDRQALLDARRWVIRFHFRRDIARQLHRLTEGVA